jgi:uncharacterized membrane protein YfcA
LPEEPTVSTVEHSEAVPAASATPAPVKIAPVWKRAVLGLFIALGATLMAVLFHLVIFPEWFQSTFDRPELGNLVIRVALGVPAVSLVAFVCAFAVLPPAVFAVARSRRRWPVNSSRWSTGVGVATAACFALVYREGIVIPALILMAVPTVAGVMAGVWTLLQRTNKDLKRAYGTPEAPRP